MSNDQNWLKGAQECIDLHFKLADEFNPRMADLYSDDALIQNAVINADGSQKTRIIPAPYYKSILANAMQLAKESGDTYTYSNLVFKKEGGRVRVTYDRYSQRRNYTTPVSMLMGIEDGEAGVISAKTRVRSEFLPEARFFSDTCIKLLFASCRVSSNSHIVKKVLITFS